jgi:HEAT repeat protein
LVIPSLIALVCLAVMAFFGLLASNATPTDPSECLATIAKGNQRERWQAAYALVKLLADREASDADPVRDKQWAEEMTAVFRDLGRDRLSDSDDELARRYLALALGHLGHPSAIPVLAEGAAAYTGDPVPEAIQTELTQTRIYCTWALARINDPTCIPELIALTRDPADDLRTMAVYALGAVASADDPIAMQTLRMALEDRTTDVQWNAALALARHGDAAAIPTVTKLCDRTYLDGVGTMTAPQRAFTLQNGVRAARALATPELRTSVERLAADDPDEHVRHEARAALKAWGTPLDTRETAPGTIPAPGGNG